MRFEAYLQPWIQEAPVLAGSVVAVLFMAGVAALLGFRDTAALDEAALRQLAAGEGVEIEEAIIGADGRSALARVGAGKLLVARVMGQDVSARLAPASALRLRSAPGKLIATFGDLGYPPLHLKLQHTPAWLAELAQGAET